jgi:NDP-sugar pyrophosphorylase family protein
LCRKEPFDKLRAGCGTSRGSPRSFAARKALAQDDNSMKAMILAAGLGTRLRPLTNDRPKALVEVGGRTLLEITLSRLRGFGVRKVIVNVHHLADMVVDYLRTNNNFGMCIEVSREEVLLDTGGGLKKAARFFLECSDYGEKGAPFILHNVDVISTIDLERMRQLHFHTQALATLAVQERETSRYLLFDERSQLCGRRTGRDQAPELVRPVQQMQPWAFSGIHIISPRIFAMMSEEGAFSIIDSYLRLAAQGETILSFRADKYYWRDLGRPENLAQAERDFRDKIVS